MSCWFRAIALRLCGAAILAGACAAPAAADSDLAIQKAVDDAVLMPGAAVEFVLTVENLGPDTADPVLVTDRLPPGLAMPAGVAPAATQGSYDPETGFWTVGALQSGGSAVLAIPAQVDAEPLPLCIVNRAEVESPAADAALANNVALAALRQPDVMNCVDLELELLRFGPFIGCGDSGVEIHVVLRNNGADATTAVRLALDSDSNVPRGLAFAEGSCGAQTACEIGELAAGATVTRTLKASDLRNSQAASYRVEVTVTSADPDYNAGRETVSLAFTKDAFTECDFGDIDAAIPPSCFIATAAYGSSLDARVQVLQDFRDQVLVKSSAGRQLVAFYYRHSPPVARYIENRPAWRAVVSGLLWPLVTAIAHPVWWLTSVTLLVLATFNHRRIVGALGLIRA